MTLVRVYIYMYISVNTLLVSFAFVCVCMLSMCMCYRAVRVSDATNIDGSARTESSRLPTIRVRPDG